MTSKIWIAYGPDRAALHAALQEGIDVIFLVRDNFDDDPKEIRVGIRMLRVTGVKRREWDIEGYIVWCGWAQGLSGKFTGHYQLLQGRTGHLEVSTKV